MRVLVCGGRNYWKPSDINLALARLHAKRPITLLIHGGAPGADKLSGDWAREVGVPVQVFPADWKAHGKAAGPIRNRRMLAEGHPDGVVAFPGGAGTADMIAAAREAGLTVWQPYAAAD